jgi:hypothetical protein
MANTTVGASVQVEFASVGQMRKAIKEATSDLIAMQEQFGKTSPQAIEAAKRIADLKDRIQDAKEQADLFDPGKRFSAFANAANQIAAGFSAVQGAMALVGTESEDLQKTLVKVQGAIALSQGLSQLKDLGKAYDEVKIVAVDAFKSIRAAIGSTGIGLLVVALGVIVAYWDDIKEAVSGVSAEQKKLNEDSEKNVKAQKDKLDAINGQENILKLQGKSEKEILQIKIKQTDEIIKASEIQLQNSITTTKAQVEAAQRNKDILQGILVFISAPIAALLKGIDLIGDAVGKNFDLYNKFYGGISSFVFDPKEVKEEGDAAIKEQEKALTDLKNQRAGFQLAVNNIDKQSAAKRAENKKKSDEDALKKQQTADKVLDDARRAKLTEQQREEEDALRAFDQRKKDLQLANKTDFTSIEEQKEIELKAIRDKYKKIQEDADKKAAEDKAEKDKDEAERLKAAQEATLKAVQEQNQALLDAEIELQNQRFNAAQAGLELLASLAGQNEKIANIIFAVQKGLEIARIIADTARGIVAAKAGLAAVPPFIGVAPNPAFILAAASAAKQIAGLKISAAVGIAQIAGASIAKFKGGGGAGAVGGGGVEVAGGGAAPMSATPSATVTAQALNAQAINNLSNQGVRAYVLNSDIQNVEQRNAYLERSASVGGTEGLLRRIGWIR